MSGEPLVSVIIPAFNAAWCIRRAVASVLAQKLDEAFEVIVVDDASTDGTHALVAEIPDVRLFRLPDNRGPGAARNRAVAKARGRYIAFLDADDVMLPGRLGAQCEYLDANPDIVLTFGAVVFASRPAEPYVSTGALPDGWSRLRYTYETLLTHDGEVVNTMTATLRRASFLAAGGFDEAFRCGEDSELWVRLSRLGDFAFTGTPLALVNDTRREGKLTASAFVYTDGPRANIKALRDDDRLSPKARKTAVRRCRRSAAMMLRYDWTERGRRALLRDLALCRGLLGPLFQLQWHLIACLPSGLGRSLRRLARRFRRHVEART